MALLERTQELLEKHLANGYSMAEIASSSNGTVDYYWLQKLSQGKVGDPGVRKVEGLYDHLKSLPSKKSN